MFNRSIQVRENHHRFEPLLKRVHENDLHERRTLLFAILVCTVSITNGQVSLGTMNLFAATNNGSEIQGVTVGNTPASSGNLLSGMTTLFQPFSTNGTKTAAIGRDAAGNFYFLPNEQNHGAVDLYAVNSLCGNKTKVASLDLNGSGSSSLGFVRLGIDRLGYGWILAGDDNDLYLAKFKANGTSATTMELVNAHVTISGGGDNRTFRNGDLCFDGKNKMYVLANDGSGETNIYTMSPYTNFSTLVRRFSLLTDNAHAFTGQVNGVAFDGSGSLYISTLSSGLYFIDQHTVNYAPVPATVNCRFIMAMTGLTDLASNDFPQETTLPVTLLSFNSEKKGNTVQLKWQTATEENAMSFEVERSNDGKSFARIGTVPTAGAGTSYSYQDLPPMSTDLYYRLKMIDRDGQFQYSTTLMVKAGDFVASITAFPNPFVDHVQFTVQTVGVTAVSYQLFGAGGRPIAGERLAPASGTRSYSIQQLTRLPRGCYLLKVETGTESKTFQLVKQ